MTGRYRGVGGGTHSDSDGRADAHTNLQALGQVRVQNTTPPQHDRVNPRARWPEKRQMSPCTKSTRTSQSTSSHGTGGWALKSERAGFDEMFCPELYSRRSTHRRVWTGQDKEARACVCALWDRWECAQGMGEEHLYSRRSTHRRVWTGQDGSDNDR